MGSRLTSTTKYMSDLEIHNVHFSYGSMPVIRGVDLTIRSGEIACVMGPNGAGKSTLLKLMAGLLKPLSGNIVIGGVDMAAMSPAERSRHIAFVPQETHMPFPFSAMETVLMGRAPYLPRFGFESKGDVIIARDAMVKTDCMEFEGRNIDSLSGGEKQRVIIARALAQQSSAILLDEPMTFLDLKHVSSLGRILRATNEENGTTIICTIHDIHTAISMCDRVILLKDGIVAAGGTPGDIIRSDVFFDVFEIDRAEFANL